MIIINAVDPVTKEALEALSRSTYVFRLTGSRFFGTANADSDWDFFTYNMPEVEYFLNQEGFRAAAGLYSNDPTISKVLRRRNIHVQLVKDAEIKERAQEILLAAGKLNPTDVDWQRMFSLLDGWRKP